MPIAVVNASNASWAASTTSVTSSPTFASTAGNLLIVGTVSWNGGSEAAVPITNVGGDTWVRSGTLNNYLSDMNTGLLYAVGIHGNAAEAATYTISAAQFPSVVLLEASGCDATSPNDIAITFANGNSVATLTTPLITPAAGQHLLVVVAQNAAGSTTVAQTVTNAGTGAATWTVIQNNTQSGEPILVAYAIVTADGSSTYGATYNPGVASNQTAGIAAFKAAAGAATYPITVSATQAQSLGRTTQAHLSRAVAQAQALSLPKQPRLVRSLAQAQAASVVARAVRTYPITVVLGGAPYNPRTECELFFCADDLALTNGAVVSSWPSTGTNTSAVAGNTTAGQQGTFVTNAINGTHAVYRQTASSTGMDGNWTPASTAGMNILAVVNPSSAANYPMIACYGTNTYFELRGHINTLEPEIASSGTITSSVALVVGTPAIVGTYAVVSGATMAVDINATRENSGTGLNFFALTNFIIGNRQKSVGYYPWVGDIACVAYFSGVMDPNVKARVEGWMAWTYGLQASLPTSHPYYSAPPGGAGGGQTQSVSVSISVISGGLTQVDWASGAFQLPGANPEAYWSAGQFNTTAAGALAKWDTTHHNFST